MTTRFGKVLRRVEENDPSLTNVNLQGQGIGDGEAKELASALRRNTHAAHLWLEDNEISVAGARSLARELVRNRTVETLSLVGNRLGDAGAGALAKALPYNESVVTLELNRNGIGNGGAEALALALCRNRSVAKLRLGSNGIGDGGARALARALLRNRTVQVLGLRCNDIRDGGAEALAAALRLNASVFHVDLAANEIGKGGASALACAMRSLRGDPGADASFAEDVYRNPLSPKLGLKEIAAVGKLAALEDIGEKELELASGLQGVPRKVKRAKQPRLLKAVYEAGVERIVKESHSLGEGAVVLLLERVGPVLGLGPVLEVLRTRPDLL